LLYNSYFTYRSGTIYLIMKKPTTTTEKPVTTAKAEQSNTPTVAKAAPKKPSPDQKRSNKAQVGESIAKAEETIAPVVNKATPKKPSSAQKAPKKAEALTPQAAVATPEITVKERIGLTAGSIWHYLAENGAAPVAKLVRELTEEEKIIQRSIGWLAQEGKITLNVVDRVETLALKE
jgi:hypothetical protein